MILSILPVVLVIVVATGAVLLFSPFRVEFTFETSGLSAGGVGVFSFLHPALVSVAFDLSDRSYAIRILGRQIGKKKDPEEPVPPEQPRVLNPGMELPEPIHPNVTAETPRLPENAEGDLTTEPVTEDGGKDARPENSTQNPLQPQEPVPVEKTVPSEDAITTVHAPSPETPPITQVPPPVTDFPPVKETIPKTKNEEKVVPETKKRDNWFKRLDRNRYLFFIRNNGWREKIFRWLFRVACTFFRIVRFNRFEVAVRAGVSDPVITGTLSGFYQAARYGLPVKRPLSLSFEPVFMSNHFECRGSIQVATSLSQLLLPVVVAVAAFPTLHTLWLVWLVFRRERRYKKEATV